MKLRTWFRAGFTLIELLVVVLIIGILAAIAIPQYFKVVEKGRFAEASACMAVVKGSQERYLLKNNDYADAVTNLDVECAAGRYFGTVGVTGNTSGYTATVTRVAPLPQTYSNYTVTFTGPAGVFSCSSTACVADLLP